MRLPSTRARGVSALRGALVSGPGCPSSSAGVTPALFAANPLLMPAGYPEAPPSGTTPHKRQKRPAPGEGPPPARRGAPSTGPTRRYASLAMNFARHQAFPQLVLDEFQ